jgi:hypothetical protein
MNKLTLLFFGAVCLLAGCGREKTAVTENAPPQPTPEEHIKIVDSLGNSRFATDQDLGKAPPISVATPETKEPVQLESGSLTESVKQFQAAVEDMKNVPPPQNFDPVHNPQSVAALVNQYAAKYQAVKRTQDQVESQIGPNERAAWLSQKRKLLQSTPSE